MNNEKFEGFEVIVDAWKYGSHSQIKEALVKIPTFRNELKRHKIKIELFLRCGSVINQSYKSCMAINMFKYQNSYGYEICKINSDSLISELEPTTHEKLVGILGRWDEAEYSVEIGRKYAYVCRNNGAFHRGDSGHLGGYATFIGKFDINGDLVEPRS